MVQPTCSKRITRLLPTHIGGPGTILPRIVESILTWGLAISCLTVALWHYCVDKYKTRIALERETDHRKHRQYLPLTTHSRREWATVSNYEGVRTRYNQLLQLIYNAINKTHSKVHSEEEKDKGDGNEFIILDEKTCRCPENQSQEHNSHLLSKGEIVAKWLSSGVVVSQKLQISQSNETSKPDAKNTSDENSNGLQCDDSRKFLIRFLCNNEPARRLVSLLLGEDPISGSTSFANASSDLDTTETKNMESKGTLLERLSSKEPGAEALLQALRRIWPRLLELPKFLPSANENSNADKITISIIVPAFREEGGQLATKLTNSLNQAAEPHRIEIIVVHVVEKGENCRIDDEKENSNDDLSSFAEDLHKGFESTIGDGRNDSAGRRPLLRILNYHGGGGRGPCLNYGASHARGDILTFLHADTRLDKFGWDKAILKVLSGNGNTGQRVTCCAFSFAIDTSPEALTIPFQKSSGDKAFNRNDPNSNQQYHPPGLRAIEITANLRCKFFALPYGDQCLSLSRNVFFFVGGYPDQCLMEDYELIRLLRMRSAATMDWSKRSDLDPDSSQEKEAIKIIFDYKAICSPRRWQKYGVLYVTYTNSYCVKLYNNGKLTPDGLFCQYYGTATSPNRIDGDRSPWERGLIAERN